MSHYNMHISIIPPSQPTGKISVRLLKTSMIPPKELPCHDLLEKSKTFQVVTLFNFGFYLHAEKPSKVIMALLPSFGDCVAVDTGPVTVVDATEGTDCRFKGENEIKLK